MLVNFSTPACRSDPSWRVHAAQLLRHLRQQRGEPGRGGHLRLRLRLHTGPLLQRSRLKDLHHRTRLPHRALQGGVYTHTHTHRI